MRLPRVTEFAHLGGFRLHVCFSDGSEGDVDLKRHFEAAAGLLAELSNEQAFAKVSLDREFGVLAWPNGVEFDPLLLWSEATGKPLPGQRTVSQNT